MVPAAPMVKVRLWIYVLFLVIMHCAMLLCSLLVDKNYQKYDLNTLFLRGIILHSLTLHFSWQPITLELGGKKSYSSIWWCWHWQRYVYILRLTKFLNFICICGLLQFANNLTDQNAKHLKPSKPFIGIWDFDRHDQLSRLLQQELLWYWKLVLRICKIQCIKLREKTHILAVVLTRVPYFALVVCIWHKI
jgi:hypothetical protein